jgi:hypothetical protein
MWQYGGTTMTSVEVHLIVPYGVTCGTGASASIGDITFGQQYTMNQPIRTFLYSPCDVGLQNNGNLDGQFYGGTISFTQQTQIRYRPVSGVPGYSPTTTVSLVRRVSMLYKREVSA